MECDADAGTNAHLMVAHLHAGSASCCNTRWASGAASSGCASPGCRMMNSSPPRRATKSPSRTSAWKPPRYDDEQVVSDVVAEGIMLTSLKPSRSIITNAVSGGAAGGGALGGCSMNSRMHWRNCTRFARPVNVS